MRLRRAVLVWLVSLCGLAGGLVVGAGVAGAEVSHSFVTSFDGSETPAGSFGKAEGLAVDSASGAVYVADRANNVVDEFKVNGSGEYKYVCQITGSVVPSASECAGLAGSATPAGGFSFEEPASLAVDNSGSASDPSNGDLYVLDKGHDVIDKFDPNGEYITQLSEAEGQPRFEGPDGIAVDSSGVLWLYLEGNWTVAGFSDAQTNEYFTSRNAQATGFAEPGLAVDSGDGFYVVHDSSRLVAKVSSAGEVLQNEVGGVTAAGVAADLSNDDVFIDSGSLVSEFDSAGDRLVQFGAAQLASGGPGAVAVDPVVGTVYVANATDGKVYVFAATPGPRVTTQSATGVEGTAATLNATVDPVGSDTTYRFEYGTTTGYGQSAPAAPVDAGSGMSPVPVCIALSGLQAGTTYHYRVVASNANGGPMHSGDGTFTTLPSPAITGALAVNVTGGSADLRAQIDPLGYDTTYRFEYGTSTAYGTDVPVPDADIGAGTSDVAVGVHLSGLSGGTTYHWRVVARNGNGTTTGSDHTFVYGTGGAGLPDGRAYEMVTPPHKNGALIGSQFGSGQPRIADDGSRLVLSTVQCFGAVVACPVDPSPRVGVLYEFARTGGGWSASALVPSVTRIASSAASPLVGGDGSGLFEIPTSPGAAYDWFARGADGSFSDVGPILSPVYGIRSIPGLGVGVEAATVSLSHFVYGQESGLFSRAPFWPFDATVTGGGATSLYEYVGVGDSAPVLVGVSGGPGSTDLISQCGTGLGGGTDGQRYNALSEGGGTVFFTARRCASGTGVNVGVEVPANGLFARVDESRTVPISARSLLECTAGSGCSTSPASDAGFVGASVDGSKAFFLDTQQLTNNASEDNRSLDTAISGAETCSQAVGLNGCNLYEYDFADPTGRNLRVVSAGDVSGGGPRVQGVMAVTPDGSRVYFVAKGVLTSATNSQGEAARDGTDNLYVFERDASYPAGRMAFIASLPGVDAREWGGVGGAGQAKVVNVTPDGRFLAFTSHGALTTDDSSSTGAAQVFRYDALTGRLVRISVGEEGFNDNGNAGLGDARIVAPIYRPGPPRTDPSMSDDGSFVFFESPVALTPGALDDVLLSNRPSEPKYAENVYEWHEGHVHLLSDGRDVTRTFSGPCNSQESSVCLLGADVTGRNVFFTTADPLVSEDGDSAVDVYDARVCTAGEPCIAAAGSVAAPCQGEACHGAAPGAPLAAPPGSVAFTGPGNVAPSAPVVKAKARKHTQKTHAKPNKKRRRTQGADGRPKRHAGKVSRRHSHTSRAGGK